MAICAPEIITGDLLIVCFRKKIQSLLLENLHMQRAPRKLSSSPWKAPEYQPKVTASIPATKKCLKAGTYFIYAESIRSAAWNLYSIRTGNQHYNLRSSTIGFTSATTTTATKKKTRHSTQTHLGNYKSGTIAGIVVFCGSRHAKNLKILEPPVRYI